MEPADTKNQLCILYSLYFQIYFLPNHFTNPYNAPAHMFVSLNIYEGTKSDPVPESLQVDSQLRGI